MEIDCSVQNKREQAEIRARLAKAKSIQEALLILKTSGKTGRMCTYRTLTKFPRWIDEFFFLISNHFS